MKMLMHKKGGEFSKDWAEYIALTFLIVGFIVSLSSRSAAILYAIALLSGAMLGRWWFRFKKSLKVPAAIIITGFLIGYVLGSFYGSRKVVVALFMIGMVLSYVLHDKKIIQSTEY